MSIGACSVALSCATNERLLLRSPELRLEGIAVVFAAFITVSRPRLIKSALK